MIILEILEVLDFRVIFVLVVDFWVHLMLWIDLWVNFKLLRQDLMTSLWVFFILLGRDFMIPHLILKSNSRDLFIF